MNYLAGEGVNVLLAGGMGMRPLMGFNQAGVEVYYAGNFPTVGQSVQAFIEGKLPAFTPRNTLRRALERFAVESTCGRAPLPSVQSTLRTKAGRK